MKTRTEGPLPQISHLSVKSHSGIAPDTSFLTLPTKCTGADQAPGPHSHSSESRHLRRVWADEGRGGADAHVHWLMCSEVLQRRSPKDGFVKGSIGRESEDRAAQGHLWSATSVDMWSKTAWHLTCALWSWWRFCSERMRHAPRTQRERQRQFSHNGGPGRRPAERGSESVL